MTAVPDSLWRVLESGTAEERVRAARQLGEFASRGDLGRIRALVDREPERLTRDLLAQVYERLGSISAGELSDDERQVERKATQELAGLFLHELSPLLGVLEAEAAKSVQDYDVSKLKEIVERIRAFLAAVRRLQEASAQPEVTGVDLTSLVDHVVADVAGEFELRQETGPMPPIDLARTDHVSVSGDRELLRLALANGLRNAIEACLSVSDYESPPRIVINWGVTDRDHWISILDDGRGLPRYSGDLFAPAQTFEKEGGHLGMGLGIARTAMEGLLGTVALKPRSPRGVSYEMRWPRMPE